jgi:hypothetical protein
MAYPPGQHAVARLRQQPGMGRLGGEVAGWAAGRAPAEMPGEDDGLPGQRIAVRRPHRRVTEGAEAMASPLEQTSFKWNHLNGVICSKNIRLERIP